MSFPMLVTSSGRRYRFSGSAETLIGSRGCAITLTDPGVAARHARILPSGSGFAIEDLGGGTKVNGRHVRGTHPLQPGDTIAVGKVRLTYQGPASASVPPSAAPSPSPPPTPAPRPPTTPVGPRPPTGPARPAVILKVWAQPLPDAEGEVTLVDGPHSMEKGNTGARFAAAAALGLLTKGALAFLPLMGRRDVPVWFLRVEDFHTRKNVSVIMRGQPTSLPQLGDIIAVWGRVEQGNILMKTGYSYATDSEIGLR